MAKKEKKEVKLYSKYLSKMSSFLQNPEARFFLKGLSDGSNKYMRIDKVESSAFDSSWIEMIEGVIFDLGDIVANPRQNTKAVSDLVPVELAKKINSESIRHLASHTQFIKDVSEGGDIIPNKILSISHDDDLHTYENRFIATFIRKLLLFVEKRYEFITQFAPLQDEEILMLKNHSFIDDSEVEIETKIKVKTTKADDTGIIANSFIDRVEKIREYILYFYSSPFMKQFKTERDVRNPILQTNIIRKNLKYHHCYEVYRFIEKYTSLGVNYKVDESYSKFDNEELQELNYLNLVSFLSIKAKHMSKLHKTNKKVYKPRIGLSYDDEAFVHGPLTNEEIQFVRTDVDYISYLQSQLRNDLPLHLTNIEKDYYQEELNNRKRILKQIDELEKLKRRKIKETAKFDKLFEAYVKERNQEEERVKLLVKSAVKELSENALNEIRKYIVEEAKKDSKQIKQNKNNKEKDENALTNVKEGN